MPPKANPSKSSRAKSSGPPAEEGLLTQSASMKTRSGFLYVAVPIKPKPKPHLKKKDPAHAVPLMEEEEFQETFNLAKCTQTGLILNACSSQMSSEPTWDADDLLPSHKAKSKCPSVQSRASDEDPDDDADDFLPSRKVKSKCPSMQSRAPDEDLDDDADDLPPSHKAKSKRPSMQSQANPSALPCNPGLLTRTWTMMQTTFCPLAKQNPPSVQSWAPDEDLDDDADDLPPSHKAKSKCPSMQSRASDEDPDDDADNFPPSRKAKSKHLSVRSRAPDEEPDNNADDLPPSRKAKSKHPSVQSRAPDEDPDDNADDFLPSHKAKSKHPSMQCLDPINVDTDQPPSSRTEKSKCPSSHPQGPASNVDDADQPPPSCKEMSQCNNEHSWDPDDDNRADVPPPAHKETPKPPQDHPSFHKESKCASPSLKSRDVDNNVGYSLPTPRAHSRRRSTASVLTNPGISNQKWSKVSLLDCPTTQVKYLEMTTQQLPRSKYTMAMLTEYHTKAVWDGQVLIVPM
ncbi:hypothetical protein HYDPIDRAFT_34585 [Hydnomerulius pinastri MD-312]|uniref:Uncharacterized protein n=1 Tax=Hydnomerulius pinastri MD-312 TaxID=994086 RepID=A0A0C9W5S3_9AGAM|nr:hypothetical protein HYDPIDRAFT_34585 [Hydnomerulius pinastri MD-312]